MVNIKAVIFDFGGVLIDWNPYYLFRKLLVNDTEIERFLQEVDFNSWNREFDKGYPFPQGITDLIHKFPGREELIRQFDERWEETIGGVFNRNIELLQQLKNMGMPLFGFTNFSVEKFALVRSKYEFFDLFEDIIVSGVEKMAKPDPQIYRLLLDRIGFQAQECVYIDDSEDNIRIGKTLGLHAIHYQTSHQLLETLKDMGINLTSFH